MTNADDQHSGSVPAWRRFAAIAAVAGVCLVGWLVIVAYPAYVERTKRSFSALPAAELAALRERYQPKNLSFSSSACVRQESRDAPSGVTSQAWNPDGALAVSASVAERCGVAIPVGRYSAEGGKLRLEYLVHAGKDAPAMCICAYELRYAITGLERRTYDIEIVAGR